MRGVVADTPSLLVVTFAPDEAHPYAALEAAVSDVRSDWDAEAEDLCVSHVVVPRAYAAWHDVVSHLRTERPDWFLLVDLDPDSSDHKVHVFGANLDDSPLPDVDGVVREDHIIDPDGPVAFRTRLPQDGIWDKFIVERVPVRMSHKAGGHVFNHMLYRVLQAIHDEGLRTLAGAVETPPIEPMPDAAGAPRTSDEVREELRMLLAVLRQLRGAVPDAEDATPKPSPERGS